MSEYCPKVETMTLFRTMAVSELNALGRDVPGYKKLDETYRVSLANMRAALRVLGQAGAIKKSWLEKQDMVTERGETSAALETKLHDILAKHVGETGETEDLVETPERIIAERDNVKRNRR